MGFGGAFGKYPLIATTSRLTPLGSRSSTVEEALQATLSRIELDPTRVLRASQHYQAIKNLLENELSVEVRQVGSFQRSTKIRPLGGTDSIDIDALVCFGDATHFYSTPGQGITGFDVLNAVYRVLAQNGTYKAMQPTIDSPVVTVSYASEFSVELVPCYRNRMPPNGWLRSPASYLVSNSSGGWEVADYDYDSAYITLANKNANGQLVPAIKLLKRFLRNKGIALKSFHVEILCAVFLVPFIIGLRDQGFSCSRADLMCFFLNLSPALLQQAWILPGSLSTAPLVEQPLNMEQQLSEWGGICAELIKLPESQRKLELWRRFYGEPFPAS